MADLLHELIFKTAEHVSDKEALVHQRNRTSYATLAEDIGSARAAMLALGLGRGERVAVYLEKRLETVTAIYGAAAAGAYSYPSIRF